MPLLNFLQYYGLIGLIDLIEVIQLKIDEPRNGREAIIVKFN